MDKVDKVGDRGPSGIPTKVKKWEIRIVVPITWIRVNFINLFYKQLIIKMNTNEVNANPGTRDKLERISLV